MNSVLVAEHHKILQADILWELCVCIIADYIIIHPLFVYAFFFFFEDSFGFAFPKLWKFTFMHVIQSK